MNPTQYMQMSKESYYQEFERPKGSIYSQTLHDQSLIDGEKSKMGGKTKQYLRGINFGFIRDSYNRNVSSGSS